MPLSPPAPFRWLSRCGCCCRCSCCTRTSTITTLLFNIWPSQWIETSLFINRKIAEDSRIILLFENSNFFKRIGLPVTHIFEAKALSGYLTVVAISATFSPAAPLTPNDGWAIRLYSIFKLIIKSFYIFLRYLWKLPKTIFTKIVLQVAICKKKNWTSTGQSFEMISPWNV